jgi:acid phosphatase type 7
MSSPLVRGLVLAALAQATCGVPPPPAWQDESASPFVTGPYLLLAPPDGALVACKVGGAAPVVQWWPEGEGEGSAREVTAVRDRDLWVASLAALPPGRIGYRVRSARGDSAVQHFRTGGVAGEHFRFAVYGDTRDGHQIHRAVVEGMAREDLDFVMHTGDMVANGGVTAEWDLFFQIERPLLDHVPIVPAIGNHDTGGRLNYPRYFQVDRRTGGLRYMVHDWGHLRALVIDVGVEFRQGSAQYAFAEHVLREGAERGMLMAILLHNPAYSSGAHGSDLDVQEVIGGLASRYGVELVVSGHDHDYERTIPIAGVTYLVSGSAGAPIRPVRPRWFTAEARTEPHYILVDAEASQLVVRAVNLRGEVFDSVVLPDNAPAR